MAGSFADYLEDELLDHVFGGSDYTRPATVYIALYTVAPGDAGGGTECAAADYARLSITNNATNFPASSGGAKANGTEFAWSAATNDWGTIVAFGIFDAVSGGNLLCWADLSASKAVGVGDTAKFPIGDLDITLT
jgi:hypothetical protein